MLDTLCKLERGYAAYFKENDSAWLDKEQKICLDEIGHKKLILASSTCGSLSYHHSMSALRDARRFDSGLVHWADFRLSMEYKRFVFSLEASDGRVEEVGNTYSLAKRIALLLYGLLTDRRDIVEVHYPVIRRFMQSDYDRSYPGYDALYILHVVARAQGEEFPHADLGPYRFAFEPAEQDDEFQAQLTEAIEQHIRLSKGEGPYYTPVNVIPLDILYCLKLCGKKTATELDKMLEQISSFGYEFDDVTEEIEVMIATI
ncbi:hypothetical protein EDC56_3241 [Sinobacterium caligoides]|uniref:Uncharacterized protein n=1 Tax=Sinobacterium caligoides TaxID=933926 RepID=A0A3N2DGY3_9GAMM|nr:hypothetical protein [Sinobacterium caligoides]ROR99001.1 hypothetical protein EDC56_3241 [Sinobacterium caligoides]